MRKKNGKFHKKDKGYYKQPASNGNLLSYADECNNTRKIEEGKFKLPSYEKFLKGKNWTKYRFPNYTIKVSYSLNSSKWYYSAGIIDLHYYKSEYDALYAGYIYSKCSYWVRRNRAE